MNQSRFNPIFGVVVTSDITFKKVSGAPPSVSQASRRVCFPLYILFIYRCHIMSLRHHPLLQGLSCVTFVFPLLSFVTLYAGA